MVDKIVRAKPAASCQIYTNSDHTDADGVPNVYLTHENPLGGIKKLARQVRRAGIRRVRGNVAIDDRLFKAEFNPGPEPTPVMINDNVIDVVAKPTSSGHRAKVRYRPHASTLDVSANVRTVPGKRPSSALSTVHVTGQAPGQIEVTGTVAAGSPRIIQPRTSLIPRRSLARSSSRRCGAPGSASTPPAGALIPRTCCLHRAPTAESDGWPLTSRRPTATTPG